MKKNIKKTVCQICRRISDDLEFYFILVRLSDGAILGAKRSRTELLTMIDFDIDNGGAWRNVVLID